MDDIEIYTATYIKMRNVFAMMTDLGLILVDFNKGIYRVVSTLKVNCVPNQYAHAQAVTSDGRYFVQNVCFPDS
jgi:hypothetical protein